jgi:hypothetical protein
MRLYLTILFLLIIGCQNKPDDEPELLHVDRFIRNPWKNLPITDSISSIARNIAKPYILKEFDLDADSLKNYRIKAEQGINGDTIRIELSYFFKSVSPDSEFQAMSARFPKYFDAIVYLPSKKVFVSWSPTPKEIKNARTIGSSFIERTFKISRVKQNSYKEKMYYSIKGDEKVITLDYYDPKIYPDWDESFKAFDSGWPNHFYVSVNLRTHTIVRSYPN